MSSAVCLDSAPLVGFAAPSSGFSHEAGQVWMAVKEVMQNRLGSESLFGEKLSIVSELITTAESLCVDDDQVAVTASALANAEQIVLALPDELPLPETEVDPDGDISLTWYVTRTRMFSASIGESDRIAFAWLYGSDKGHAVARFRMSTLPAAFVSMLRMVVADAPSAIRAA